MRLIRNQNRICVSFNAAECRLMHFILESFLQCLSRMLMDTVMRVFTKLRLKLFVRIRSKIFAATFLRITRYISAPRPVSLPAFQLYTFINFPFPCSRRHHWRDVWFVPSAVWNASPSRCLYSPAQENVPQNSVRDLFLSSTNQNTYYYVTQWRCVNFIGWEHWLVREYYHKHWIYIYKEMIPVHFKILSQYQIGKTRKTMQIISQNSQ
jgi:hypothetical protein